MHIVTQIGILNVMMDLNVFQMQQLRWFIYVVITGLVLIVNIQLMDVVHILQKMDDIVFGTQMLDRVDYVFIRNVATIHQK